MVHSVVYDPNAEKFAAEKKAAEAKAAAAAADQKNVLAKEAADKAAKEKADAEAAAAAKAAEDRNKFDIVRLLGRVMGIIFTILMVFLLLVLGVYGASLATNLNVHHEWPYRLLYAIWGFVFFIIVIPYSLIYRWWWKGYRPRFYALIPLVPYKFENYYAAMLLSWMSFKPDEAIADLREWEHLHK